MIRKRAFLVLAVGVLMGTMAVVGLAGDQGLELYGPADSSISSQPEQGVEQQGMDQQGMDQQGVEHSDAGEIREPVETGSVPDPPVSSSDFNCCTNSTDPTYWMGGP